MVVRYGWGEDDERIHRAKRCGDELGVVGIVDVGTLFSEGVRQGGGGQVIACDLVSLAQEVAYERTHPDASDANKIQLHTVSLFYHFTQRYKESYTERGRTKEYLSHHARWLLSGGQEYSFTLRPVVVHALTSIGRWW